MTINTALGQESIDHDQVLKQKIGEERLWYNFLWQSKDKKSGRNVYGTTFCGRVRIQSDSLGTLCSYHEVSTVLPFLCFSFWQLLACVFHFFFWFLLWDFLRSGRTFVEISMNRGFSKSL